MECKKCNKAFIEGAETTFFEGNVLHKECAKKERLERKGFIYECPQCETKGFTIETYNAYPSNLPDSNWVIDPKQKEVLCDLCNGKGYTSLEFVPNMIQDGWKPK